MKCCGFLGGHIWIIYFYKTYFAFYLFSGMQMFFCILLPMTLHLVMAMLFSGKCHFEILFFSRKRGSILKKMLLLNKIWTFILVRNCDDFVGSHDRKMVLAWKNFIFHSGLSIFLLWECFVFQTYGPGNHQEKYWEWGIKNNCRISAWYYAYVHKCHNV